MGVVELKGSSLEAELQDSDTAVKGEDEVDGEVDGERSLGAPFGLWAE